MKNAINPDHYKAQCSLECIEAMEMAFGNRQVLYFCLCNAFKYLWRYKNKNGMEDLEKASWYIDRAKYELNFFEYPPSAINEKILAMDNVLTDYIYEMGGKRK